MADISLIRSQAAPATTGASNNSTATIVTAAAPQVEPLHQTAAIPVVSATNGENPHRECSLLTTDNRARHFYHDLRVQLISEANVRSHSRSNGGFSFMWRAQDWVLRPKTNRVPTWLDWRFVPQNGATGMCLGVPGKVIETYEEHDVLMGRVDFGGVFKRACLAHTPTAQPGQYVIVHVGFALQVIDEAEAMHLLNLGREAALDDHGGLPRPDSYDREMMRETAPWPTPSISPG